LSFVILFIIVDLFDRLDDLLQYDIGLIDIIYYYLNFVPEVMVVTLPIAVLLASISFFRKLSSSNEYVAMVGGGYSLTDMLKPLVISVLIVSSFSFVLDSFVVPKTYYNIKKIRAEKFINKNDPHKKLVNEVHVVGKKDQHIHMASYNIEKKEAETITIMEFREGSDKRKVMERKIMAEKARWNGNEWVLEKVKVFDQRAGYINEVIMEYPSMLTDLGVPPEGLLVSSSNPKAMSLGELRSYSNAIGDKNSKQYLGLRIELHKRFAFSFVPLAILLVAVPFGLMQKRGHKFLSIGIGIMIGLVYYLVLTVFWSFGRGGMIPPFLANWIPNLMFVGVAWIMIQITPR